MSRLAEKIRNTEPWCTALLYGPTLEFSSDNLDTVALEKMRKSVAFRAIWRPGFVVKYRVLYRKPCGELYPHEAVVLVRQRSDSWKLEIWSNDSRAIAKVDLEEGKPLPSKVRVSREVVSEVAALEGLSFEITEDALERTSSVFLSQFGWTLALLSCKNIRLEERKNPPKKRSKGKDKRQVESYWVLDIPGSGDYWERNAAGERGIQHRLHVVRGHFNNYTEEKPHVSGWVGPMWISSHARGNAELGLVEKDYNLSGVSR